MYVILHNYVAAKFSFPTKKSQVSGMKNTRLAKMKNCKNVVSIHRHTTILNKAAITVHQVNYVIEFELIYSALLA